MIGTTISHYRVIEKLGGGGMGVVYKELLEGETLKQRIGSKPLETDVLLGECDRIRTAFD